VVDAAEIKLANKKLIFVMNCRGGSTASGTARILATQSSASGRKVVLWDKTGQSIKDVEVNSKENNSELPLINISKCMSLMNDDNGEMAVTSPNFSSTIKSLLSEYDQVFVCTNNNEGELALMALKDFLPSIVVIAGLRRTKKIDIKKIKQYQPIDILFYD
jgi:hypothetical protein